MDEQLVADVRERLAHRYPPAAGATVERRVGGALRHDARRAPDHRAASATVSTPPAASAATASCSRRRSGVRVAEEMLGLEPSFDLAPYRLERFAGDEVFPEELVL